MSRYVVNEAAVEKAWALIAGRAIGPRSWTPKWSPAPTSAYSGHMNDGRLHIRLLASVSGAGMAALPASSETGAAANLVNRRVPHHYGRRSADPHSST